VSVNCLIIKDARTDEIDRFIAELIKRRPHRSLKSNISQTRRLGDENELLRQYLRLEPR
jgi:hypothetical protein